MSISPVSPSHPLDWREIDSRTHHNVRHTVEFYERDESLVTSVARFLGSALGAGRSAVAIATAPHRRALDAMLSTRGFHLPSLIERGQYVSLDARVTLETLCDGESIDRNSFRDVVGGVVERTEMSVLKDHGCVAAFGEMVSLLCEDGRPDLAAELEECWNQLALTHSFTLHCAYPMRLFRESGDGEALRVACEAHEWVVPSESYMRLPTERERLFEVTRLQQQALALEGALREREEILREREQARLEVEAALRSREDFLGIAAHELRTPLTLIKGVADVLARKAAVGSIDGEDIRRSIPLLQDGATRLVDLCDQLLACVISGDFVESTVDTVDLRQVVDMAVEQVTAIDGGSHSFFRTFDEREPTVSGNRNRLLEVLVNVLENAVKYSPSETVVSVSVSSDGEAVTVVIEDEGMGIPADELASVFDPFRRGRNADDSEVGGRGIGLYVCRRIVMAYSGRIEIAGRGSLPGTAVTIVLPQAV